MKPAIIAEGARKYPIGTILGFPGIEVFALLLTSDF
jgi:hypothetical protein